MNGATLASFHVNDGGSPARPLGEGAITPTVKNFFQIAAPAATDECDIDGCFFYYGDFDCGVRVHNVGAWGSSVKGIYPSQENLVVGVKRFCTAVPTDGAVGAHHCKLFIIDYIGNDAGDDDPAAFKADYLTLIDDLLDEPSKPCILLWIPTYPAAATRAQWQSHIEPLYQIADERDHVAVLNLEAKMMQQDNATGWRALGGNTSDNTHYSMIGHRIVAEEIFRLLAR